VLVAVGAIVILAVATGLVASARALALPPAAVLRGV
jgi:hypothetical protein